jgi:hypothetical protein
LNGLNGISRAGRREAAICTQHRGYRILIYPNGENENGRDYSLHELCKSSP